MTRKTELQKDRERIAGRLRASNKEKWNSLSIEDKDRAVDEFFSLTDLKSMSPLELINDSWKRAYALDMTVYGVVLGLIGGTAGTILDRHLSQAGMGYEVFVIVLFITLFVLSNHMPVLLRINDYREGRLLEKLLKE